VASRKDNIAYVTYNAVSQIIRSVRGCEFPLWDPNMITLWREA